MVHIKGVTNKTTNKKNLPNYGFLVVLVIKWIILLKTTLTLHLYGLNSLQVGFKSLARI